MKRWHDEIAIAERGSKLRASIFGTRLELGRYRKRHAMDCGNPQCHLCHSDKFPKRQRTRAELRAAMAEREQQ